MFAVIKTGGKQYRVTENQLIVVEKLLGEEDTSYIFRDVLLLEENGKITIGNPIVEGSQVIANIVKHTKGKKAIIFKKKRRHTYRRKKGHRQNLTVLRVTHITRDGNIPPVTSISAQKTVAKSDTVSSEAGSKASIPQKSKTEE